MNNCVQVLYICINGIVDVIVSTVDDVCGVCVIRVRGHFLLVTIQHTMDSIRSSSCYRAVFPVWHPAEEGK